MSKLQVIWVAMPQQKSKQLWLEVDKRSFSSENIFKNLQLLFDFFFIKIMILNHFDKLIYKKKARRECNNLFSSCFDQFYPTYCSESQFKYKFDKIPAKQSKVEIKASK